jgi:hypothetical protein
MAANTLRIRGRVGAPRAVIRVTPWEPNKDFWCQPAWNTHKWGGPAAVDASADDERRRKLALLRESLRANDPDANTLAEQTILVMSQLRDLTLEPLRRGGKARATKYANARANGEHINPLVIDVLNLAYAEIAADGTVQRGEKKLLNMAIEMAKKYHPGIVVTRSQARSYLRDHPPHRAFLAERKASRASLKKTSICASTR